MGLETPLALLGLLAVGIPWLVHRMRKRELPRVQLPTFQLLLRATAQSHRKRALTDLLLLALRIGLVALASFAIAAPYVTARIAFGDGQVSAATIVIDDSLSMSQLQAGRTLFARALDQARDAVQALPTGSQVSIVLGGSPARVLVGNTSDLSAALRRLDALPKVPTRGPDLGAAVSLAVRELSRSQAAPRRMLLLSDFARHAALDPKALAFDAIEITAVRIGDAPKNANVFIDQVTAAADPTQRGKTSVAVALRVAGDAAGALPNAVRVEVLSASDTVLAGAELTLHEGSGRLTLAVPTPTGDDHPTARVRVRVDDALAADNEASVVLTRSDALRVLLVNGDPRPGSDADELRFVTRALALVPESVLGLALRSVDPLALAHLTLDELDVIVLANVPAPNAATAQRLSEFVKRGGGLIVAAGARVDPAQYSARLGEVLGAHITSLAPAKDLRFAAVPGSAFLPDGLAGLREARTKRRLMLDASAETLLAFEDGLPALVARNVGAGRSLLLATTLDADFSDLPLRPGFLPLLVAMLRDVAGVSAASSSKLAAGEPLELNVSRNTAWVEVRDPNEQATRIAVKKQQRSLRFTATETLGAYRLFAASADAPERPQARGAFVVNAPREESDLTPGDVPTPEGPRAQSPSAQAHARKPFTSSVLLLVFLLFVVEGVARLRKRG